MKKITLVARNVLGIVFLVFGINGLLMAIGVNFLPEPNFNMKTMIVMKGFEELGYLMPLVKIIETIAGILFLGNIFVNLAIVLLLPVIVNILGLHLFVEPAGLPIAVLVTILLGILIYSRCKEFKKFLLKK